MSAVARQSEAEAIPIISKSSKVTGRAALYHSPYGGAVLTFEGRLPLFPILLSYVKAGGAAGRVPSEVQGGEIILCD